MVDEKKLAELEQRIQDLEIGKQFEVNKQAVQQVEQEFLQKFRDVQDAMRQQTTSVANSKELEALRQENQRLQGIVAKQAYRIQHMKMHLEEMLDAK